MSQVSHVVPLPLHFALASKMGARAIQAIAAAHPAALSLPFGWRERDAGQKEPVLEVGTVVSVSQDPTWSCSLGASGRVVGTGGSDGTGSPDVHVKCTGSARS